MPKKNTILWTDIYREDSRLLAQLFDEALERRDGPELTRVFLLVGGLIRQLLETLRRKYGGRLTMGTRKRYSWKGLLPAEVMADLRNTAEIDGDWIKRAKVKIKIAGLSKRAQNIAKRAVKALRSELRHRIRDGRKWMHDRWPGWWTPDIERYFENVLKGISDET
jgi:hypothetical protein